MSRHGLIDGAIVGAGERVGALPCGRDRPFLHNRSRARQLQQVDNST
jgi:hypothetical protein